MRKDSEFGVVPGKWQDIPIQAWLLSERQLLHAMMPASVIKTERLTHTTRRFAEDTEFLLAVLSKRMRLRYLAEPLYQYRVTPGSLSSARNRWEGVADMFRDAIAHFAGQPCVQKALQQSASRADQNYRYARFTNLLKAGNAAEALRLGVLDPSLFGRLIKRLFHDACYCAVRVSKGGIPRQGGGGR